MKKIDSFTNQYSLSKTLRFKLIPQGKTLENFAARKLLDQDMELALAYDQVKGYIDDYHRHFIDAALSGIQFLDIQNYATLYHKADKTAADKNLLKTTEGDLRKFIARTLTAHPDFKKLFGKELFRELLPTFLTEEEQRNAVAKFHGFITYFVGFFHVRKRLYTEEEKTTSIAYRCINDNLPRFLDNVRIFQAIFAALPEEHLTTLNEDFVDQLGHLPEDAFCIENFAYVLPQKGISHYNEIIGGYKRTDGTKVLGLNEYIYQYNQCHSVSEQLPLMKKLYKQLLSDQNTISYTPEKFQSDDEVITAVREFCDTNVLPVLDRLAALFSRLSAYNQSGIFVKNGAILSDFSTRMFGSWHTIRDIWTSEYDASYQGNLKKDSEKYAQEQTNAWKQVASFSLAELQHFAQLQTTRQTDFIITRYQSAVNVQLQKITRHYSLARKLLDIPYIDKPKRLSQNNDDIALLKNLLDALKELEWLLKPMLGTGSEDSRDIAFYNEFEDCYQQLSELDTLYNQVRNFVTKKPYSNDKIKLNFENASLLAGWDKNKESVYRTALLRKDGLYYLAVMDKSDKKVFAEYPSENSNGWEKIDCKLLPSPNKLLPKVFFAKSKMEYFAPSEEVLRINKEETFKKGPNFRITDCHKLIAFYQDAIHRHPDWSQFEFRFRNPKDYANIAEFYNDVELQGYKLRFYPISEQYLEEKINCGSLYLFQIYSKDFSPYSKGTPNLHTLYFKLLFDERNLNNVVYQINGGGEIFYRFPSIRPEERVICPKNQPIKNKNPHSGKAYSTFPYDIIKDRRYTEAQFSLHLPIKMNFCATGNGRINLNVRKALKYSDHNYVIGIDLGERNLVYITVIDDTGKIVEQFSGNQITNHYNGKEYKTDYHQLLSQREQERLQSRQNWNCMESIKDLKEGYISQIIHKICQLVIKYDAIIAMADLDADFKNSRAKIEKQVYQKFEKMLIDKLNFLADKQADPTKPGGLLHAYQLTERFESFKKIGRQNGFIFYVPTKLDNNVDPTTGFVNLLWPKFTNIAEAKTFIEAFQQIRYNQAEDLFELTFNYHDFPRGDIGAKGEWTICTYGDRVEYRKDNASGQVRGHRMVLTNEWIRLFEDAKIDYRSGNLRLAILQQESKPFFERFMYLMRMTLQMRNGAFANEPDYLISPVRNSSGSFYDSRNCSDNSDLPACPDANDAYHIARKAAWTISLLKQTADEDLMKADLFIPSKEWLAYVQRA